MSAPVLFHVQHLLGIGHLQRVLHIAEALAREGIAATIVTGGPPVAGLPIPPGLKIIQLPPVRARDARFELVDEAGQPLGDALKTARRRALLAAFAETRPGLVVIEGFPFARRAFRFELDPLIAAARQAGARIACSVRDVIQRRDDPARHREIIARVRDEFAAVLVHGDPCFIPFDASFSAAEAIADRLVYTGYVAPPAGPAGGAAASAGEVLVSAGGGGAGGRLMAVALAARRLGCLAGAPWRLLAGASLSAAEFAALQGEAPGGVAVERFRADFPALLRRCRVSVSQAGYNTVLDLVAARVPSVLVPFSAGGETEQSVRAEHLAVCGAAELVREDELTAATLAAAIERAAARRPAALAIDAGGAHRSARIIARLLDRRDLVSGGGDGMIAQ